MVMTLGAMVDRLKAVAHPLRLRVLALVGGGELCVCQVAEVLQVPQSSVSEALRELRRAGFVKERKEGRWVFVSVVDEPPLGPLLEGLLVEAGLLVEVHRDRARVACVAARGIPAVCGKPQRAEVSHV